jgi:recombinase/recombinase-like zinc beta ribbon protein
MLDAVDQGGDDKQPPKRLVIHEEEAQIVRRAFTLFLETGSLAAVRDYLKEVTVRQWTSSKVTYLLRNVKYKGVQKHGAWRNEEGHEAIVSPEIWEAVQKLLPVQSGRSPRQDAFRYFLRDRIRCPHCDCAYTCASVPRKGKYIRYYICSKDNKSLTTCPVGRLNAESLHFTILQEIERLARHRTCMHAAIAASGGWQRPSEDLQALRADLARKKQCIGMRVTNLVYQLEEGRQSQAIKDRLAKLEDEQAMVEEQLARVEADLEQATVKRPTAAQVQAAWTRLLDLWGDATEEERETILQALVKCVVANEKGRVLLELVPVPEAHGQMFALNADMGAGVGFEPTTSRL